MILVQAKGQEELCSNNTQFLFLCLLLPLQSLALLLINILATNDDEPIKDADPVALDVGIVTLDVVMDIPLRRLERARRPVISNDYIVYLHEHEYYVGDVSNSITYKEAIVSPQSNFWIDAMKDKMTSMS